MSLKRKKSSKLCNSLVVPSKLDTCRTSANLAWKALNNFGDSAFNKYWEEQKPPPIKCEKNCQCGPEKYLATFDWDNETVVYYEVNRAKSTFPSFLSLAITLSSFYCCNYLSQ